MKFKTTAVLFAMVGGLAAWVWLTDPRLQSTDERTLLQTKLFATEPEAVTYVAVTAGRLDLACSRTNQNWVVVRPFVTRADAARVERILAAIEAMTRVETITAGERRARELSLADYGLSAPRAIILIGNSRGKRTLRIGADAAQGNLLYINIPPSTDVVATQAAIMEALPTELDAFRDRVLMDGSTFRTAKLAINRSGGGFIQLVRGEGGWMIQQPFPARADSDMVDGLLDVLYASKITSFVWDQQVNHGGDQPLAIGVDAAAGPRAEAYGLDPEAAAARITVWLTGQEAGTELILGNPVGDDSPDIHARMGNADSIVTVNGELLKAFSIAANDLRNRDLFGLDPENVRRVSFEEGDARLALRKSLTSGWTITEPLQWQADHEVVDTLVRRLCRLRATAFFDPSATNVSAAMASPPDLSVTLSSATEEDAPLKGQAETNPARGAISPASPGSGGQRLSIWRQTSDDGVYARLADDKVIVKIAATDLAGLGERLTDPLAFRDRGMLAVPPANLTRITLTKGGVEQTVLKSDSGAWESAVAGVQVDGICITNLLLQVANLRASRIETHNPKSLAAFGLDHPTLTLTLGLSGSEGFKKTILFGLDDGAGGLFVMVQGQDVVFVLPHAAVNDLTGPLLKP